MKNESNGSSLVLLRGSFLKFSVTHQINFFWIISFFHDYTDYFHILNMDNYFI